MTRWCVRRTASADWDGDLGRVGPGLEPVGVPEPARVWPGAGPRCGPEPVRAVGRCAGRRLLNGTRAHARTHTHTLNGTRARVPAHANAG